ncbi:MAG: efflux RND transporter periplasmic adaptor subunit, partial [Marinomonas sp.]
YQHPGLKNGAFISEGTLVLKIDPVDYELDLAQSQADLQTKKIEVKRVNLNEQQYLRSLEIETSRLALTKKELTRIETLQKKGVASKSSLEDQRNAVLSQEKVVWDLQMQLDNIPTDRAVSEANIKVAEASLADAKRNLERTEFRLPFDARVGDVNTELQQVVNLQELLISAHDMQVMEVTANMPVAAFVGVIRAISQQSTKESPVTFSDISGFNFNAVITARLGNKSTQWDAKVTSVSDGIDPSSNTIGVTVEVKNDMDNFNPVDSPLMVKDMYVQVDVTGPAKEQIVLPVKAIHGNKVYLVDEKNELVIKTIKVAYVQGEFAAIMEGVRAGDKVILTDLIAPVSGMPIRTVTQEIE